MSILRGHENLLPKAIIGFDMGYALVQCGDGVKRYRLTVGPMGALSALPVEEESMRAVDQLGVHMEPEPDLRARRFHDIDQPTQ
ncbi:MAG TPA: hypothetical protein VNS88_00145 [Nitrospiraceae bacterium]|nr:hypothetical protein [Nitrospiraceae bacterium]